MSNDDMTIAEELRAAADYIDRRGWVQGKFETDDGRVCVSLAMHQTGGLAARLVFFNYLFGEGSPGVTGDSEKSLLGWNDAPNQTQEEVVSALRACADRSEKTT